MTPQSPSVRDRAAADKPTAPGWYECRRHDGRRFVFWRNDNGLFTSPDEGSRVSPRAEDYTDFLGPLVRDEEVERLAKFLTEDTVKISFKNGNVAWQCHDETHYVSYEHATTRNNRHETMLEAVEHLQSLSPPLSTPDDRSVQ